MLYMFEVWQHLFLKSVHNVHDIGHVLNLLHQGVLGCAA
jgi:hypothetical protein